MNKTPRMSRTTRRVIASVLLCLWGQSALLVAQTIPPPNLLPLNQVPVPEPPNLFQFVKNKPAAIKLGKAFFWDMQVGSDGVQSCASCHFSAGADNRKKNTVNPGTRGSGVTSQTFEVRGPNDTLQPGDFPFHQRSDPDFQTSQITRDSDDVVGSQGVKLTQFVAVVPGSAVDFGNALPDTVFQANGANQRRVTARNTPSVINAVFNFSNFWDGRAHFRFNGENPFGQLDPAAGVWFDTGSALAKQPVSIPFASLASQAVGPPMDDTEMSFGGRTFPHLGRKMLSLTPLGKQLVHPNDSVLGPLSRAVIQPDGKTGGSTGLSASYAQLIQNAFQDSFWNSPRQTPDGFTQMEANFSLFWGLAIQLYEATLISDQTPFDRFLGGDQNALTLQQQDGFKLFNGSAGCTVCHVSTEMTNASVRASAFLTNTAHGLLEQMTVASGADTVYDAGFNNTSVRKTTEDIGRGGKAPFTNSRTNQPFPLSFTALAQLQALNQLGFNPTLFPAGAPLTPVLPAEIPANFPVSNNGGFKVPGLRNVELTAPYFHNGGDMTLADVVDFYTRGGNFPVENQDDLDVAIADIGTLQGDPIKQAALVAFMMSMTDERVRNQSAPFDHPELFVPNGDLPNGDTEFIKLPARDANGVAASAIALTIDPVTSPTRLAGQTVRGTMEAGSTIQVSLNGSPAAAATVVANAWSIDLAGMREGVNSVAVTATDPASNATTVNASIFVDTIAPTLTLNAVVTPTSLANQILSGTVESGIVPIVLVSSTATAGPVSVIGNTWSSTLTGLATGVNAFSVVAIDLSGNAAIQTASVTFGTADGNLDGAGAVDDSDALRALRLATGLLTASPLDMLHGDVAPLVNGVPTQNSAVDLADALLILRKARSLVTF